MLGAVGAYDWSGTVVQQTSSGHLIFSKQAFDQILQDRNHSSYLGEARTPAWAAPTLARVASGPVPSWACHLLTCLLHSVRVPFLPIGPSP